MKKIVVFSDSHGSTNGMLDAVALEKPDLTLHLGDHDSDCKDITLMYPDIPIRSVRGNCDRGSQGLDIDEFVLAGKRFFITHGHLFGVKMGITKLANYAINRNVHIAMFGHTHVPLYKVYDGVTFINPGSIGSNTKSYAAIKLDSGIISCEMKCL